jgi:hypothetical protein
MAERKQGEWPAVKRQPVADFLTPDGFRRTDRSVAGQLRLGTEPRVGPGGLLTDGPGSDMGMDRITPKGFDPMGSHNTRAPAQESSSLLSRQVRGRSKPDE